MEKGEKEDSTTSLSQGGGNLRSRCGRFSARSISLKDVVVGEAGLNSLEHIWSGYPKTMQLQVYWRRQFGGDGPLS